MECYRQLCKSTILEFWIQEAYCQQSWIKENLQEQAVIKTMFNSVYSSTHSEILSQWRFVLHHVFFHHCRVLLVCHTWAWSLMSCSGWCSWLTLVLGTLRWRVFSSHMLLMMINMNDVKFIWQDYVDSKNLWTTISIQFYLT